MTFKNIKLTEAAKNAVLDSFELQCKLAQEMRCHTETVKNRAKNGYKFWDHGNLIDLIRKDSGLNKSEIIEK